MPSAEVVEIAGYTGHDFAWIDAEHGTMDLGDINTLVRAADASGIDSIVRVPDHNPSFIQRVLDAGATGIMAPHLRTAEDAAAIVAASKFEPQGTRGACPATRAVGHLADDWTFEYRRANSDTLVFGLIEDVEGVENVQAIASVPGLDGLVFGPFDLAMALGLEGDVSHPDIDKMQSKVVQATRDAGIEYVSIAGFGSGGLERMVASGSRIINVTGDRGLLYTVFKSSLTSTKDGLDAITKGAK
ncbi:HpcH/HpaI aldolase/citrate lyase family protein [Streptomyces sp. NPDC102441]|uniref:HpcH/HpaI aldolase family protein n=1 Tax=Streptomyces sp. NPDC102441 TaxID=3366176 RepID=UPI003823F7CE